MTTDHYIVARCLYEQNNRVAPPWFALSSVEKAVWECLARELLDKLDRHGYRLAYIEPEA